MSSSSTVVPLRQPDTVDDPLMTVLRDGARRLLAQAIEAEAEAFLAAMRELRLPDGRERLVRHGHGPERRLIMASPSFQHSSQPVIANGGSFPARLLQDPAR